MHSDEPPRCFIEHCGGSSLNVYLLRNHFLIMLHSQHKFLFQISDIFKGFLFALFFQHNKQFFKQFGGFRMHDDPCFGSGIIFKRMRIGIIFALIRFACGNTVAKHFFNIFQRHFNRLEPFGLGAVIHPIFIMMAVSALMMKPCRGIPFFRSYQMFRLYKRIYLS